MDVEEEIVEGFVLPGQKVCTSSHALYDSSTVRAEKEGLVALYGGVGSFVPMKDESKVVEVKKFTTMYMPKKNDLVLATVKARTSEAFICDIGSALDATLSGLEFDGATKRNKPNLQIGTVVYCRLHEYSKYTGGKLSCINKGLTNKQNQLGELKGGCTLWLPAHQHHLVEEKLPIIGKYIKFEVALGKNGWIWFNTSNPENIVVVLNIMSMLGERYSMEVFDQLVSMLKT